MPEYLKRTGRDVTDDILVRVPETENHVARLKGPASKRLGIDRGSIPSVAAPLEGQMMIQYADEAVGATPVSPEVGPTFLGESPYYYSNGEWRPFITTSVFNSDEEHLFVDTLTVASGDSPNLEWSRYDGGLLLDLSTPDQPTFATPGVYGIWAAIEVGDSTSSATPFTMSLDVVQAVPAWPPGVAVLGVAPGIWRPVSGEVFLELSRVAKFGSGASDFFTVGFFNGDSVSRDIKASLSVVRILEL